MTYNGNNLFDGYTRTAPLWNMPEDVHQTWIEYKYYQLETSLDNISIVIPARNKFIVASSWSEEYFKFMYSSVGKACSWWYMNYKTGEELNYYLNCSDRKYITLMHDGQPAGFAILTANSRPASGNRSCNLSYFGILPWFAGKGLSKIFLNECMTMASYISDSMWVYTTSLDHPAALPLYKSAGFSLVETKYTSEYFPTHALAPHHQSTTS